MRLTVANIIAVCLFFAVLFCNSATHLDIYTITLILMDRVHEHNLPSMYMNYGLNSILDIKMNFFCSEFSL